MFSAEATTAALVSVLGDLIVISTWLGVSVRSLLGCPAQTKHNFSVRFVAYLAIADLISCLVPLSQGHISKHMEEHPLVCTGMGAAEWWATWASWFWTAVIALAFRDCFVRSRTGGSAAGVQIRPGAELAAHAFCWGAPLALVGLTYASGNRFGGQPVCPILNGTAASDPTAPCGMCNPPADSTFAIAATQAFVVGILCIVITCNLWAFLSTHLLLQRFYRELDHLGALVTPGGSEPRRVQLWPTFVAYVSVFVGSQAPGAVYDILSGSGVTASSHVVNVLVILGYSHGSLNAIVYGWSNHAMVAQWRGCLTNSCCTSRGPARLPDYREAHGDAERHTELRPTPDSM